MYKYLSLAFQIASEIMAAETQYNATGSVNVPEIRTYIGKDHVSVNLTVAKIA